VEFLAWWFVDHWILSFILTPGWSFLWSLFSNYSFGWQLLCFVWMMIIEVLSAVK
jgi:hypothetical protein